MNDNIGILNVAVESTLRYPPERYNMNGETCFSVGMGGGCGVTCPVMLEGFCSEFQEIDVDDLVHEYGVRVALEIKRLYN